MQYWSVHLSIASVESIEYKCGVMCKKLGNLTTVVRMKARSFGFVSFVEVDLAEHLADNSLVNYSRQVLSGQYKVDDGDACF